MTRWPEHNPQFSDSINNPPVSALGEFARLLLGLALVSTVVMLLLIALAGRLSPLIPFSWEQQLTAGLDFNDADDEARAALTRLGQALATHIELDEAVTLEFHLLDTATPNAFATLGGHIVVTRGLIDAVDSENGLAMVLGHEIAHIHHRDPIRQLGRGAVLSLFWALITGASGQSGLENVLGTGGMLGMLQYSRGMEHAADALALDILHAHYGHAGGADAFFQRMREQDTGPAWTEFARTHPPTEQRLARIHAHSSDADSAQLRPLPAALSAWAESDQPPCIRDTRRPDH